MYYSDKTDSLRRIFGRDVVLEPDALVVGEKRYPIVDDVIVLLDPSQYTAEVRAKLTARGGSESESTRYAEDIQYTFGAEWQHYNQILPSDQWLWQGYFGFIKPEETLKGACVCDLGCGIGRWSYFLKDICKELTLVDFSDAIFVARKNLAAAPRALFFMCNIKELPFANDAFDLLFSLGVLHHLPTPCLGEVRNVSRLAPRVLIYLYYALDNRPFYFRILVTMVTWVRLVLARIRNPAFRKVFCVFGTFFIYLPLIGLGYLLDMVKLGKYVPVYEGHAGMGLRRLEQNVYDRFFTRIEQRASRKDIYGLKDTFSKVTISDQTPFWTFLCER